jgi:hypothetical protein
MGLGASGLASAGANVIGSQLQGWASLLDKWAMADAYSAELARQAGYQKQASQVFNNQLGFAGAPAAQQQLNAAYGSRLGGYNDINQVPLGFDLPYQQSGSTARDTAANQMSASQRANLNKYGDWLFGQKLANMATGRSLDQITNFAGGTASVFPYRMYDAQHSMDYLAEIGASISGASSGAAGAKAAFGGPPPTSTGGGYGQGTYYPMGPQFEGYGAMPGFQDAYGNWYPRGWNLQGGSAEGTLVPG